MKEKNETQNQNWRACNICSLRIFFIVSSTMIKNIFLRFFHFFLHTKHKVYQTFLVLSALCLIFNVILFFSHFIRTMCALTHTLSIFVWNFQTENFTCSLFSTEFCAKFLTFNREKKIIFAFYVLQCKIQFVNEHNKCPVEAERKRSE